MGSTAAFVESDLPLRRAEELDLERLLSEAASAVPGPWSLSIRPGRGGARWSVELHGPGVVPVERLQRVMEAIRDVLSRATRRSEPHPGSPAVRSS
jgi:hypothetical protein